MKIDTNFRDDSESLQPTRRLVIIPPLGAQLLPNGSMVLPAKLLNSVLFFAAAWGKDNTEVWVERVPQATNNLDNRAWTQDELPCRFRVIEFTILDTTLVSELANTLFLVMADHRLRSGLLRLAAAGVPYVLWHELTLRTQIQIANTSHAKFWKKLKTILWLLQNNWRMRPVFTRAAGIQCSGTPAFEELAALNPNRMLYLDTHTSPAMLATADGIERRFAQFRQHGRVRLLFSGRFISIKGVDQLVRTAQRLKNQGLSFELMLAGDGVLRHSIFEQVEQLGLSNEVKYLGVLDFATELMPLLRESIDLFLCPHLQGDPSTTYMETMSAGVPIVGYGNDAFLGVCKTSGTGWVVPMSRPELMAEKVIELCKTPEMLRVASLDALRFAAQHTFEQEFQSRVDHLRQIAGKIARADHAE